MKKILIIGFAMLFSFGIFAQSAERETEAALAYAKKLGFEYEVLYDQAVKILPKGAKILSYDSVEQADTARTAYYQENIVTYSFPSITVQSYVYGIYQNGVIHSYVSGGIQSGSAGNGYIWVYERNTTGNESNPSWTSITKAKHCDGGSGEDFVTSCNSSPTVYSHVIDFSKSQACSQCNGSIGVFSIRLSINPYNVTYQQTYIVGVGWVWMPVRLYWGWTRTLSAGTPPPPFYPVWDLCDTNLGDWC